MLGAAQFLNPLEISPLMGACGHLLQNEDTAISFVSEVRHFQEVLMKLKQFQIDGHEYACLRAVVLFKTGEGGRFGDDKELSNPSALTALQDSTQLTLSEYISTAHPEQPLRFGKLLLLLPYLKSVHEDTIVELFFRKTIGNIPIVRIICDMYKSSSTDLV